MSEYIKLFIEGTPVCACIFTVLRLLFFIHDSFEKYIDKERGRVYKFFNSYRLIAYLVVAILIGRKLSEWLIFTK